MPFHAWKILYRVFLYFVVVFYYAYFVSLCQQCTISIMRASAAANPRLNPYRSLVFSILFLVLLYAEGIFCDRTKSLFRE